MTNDDDESLGLLGKLIDRKIEQQINEIVPSMVKAQLRAMYNRPISDLFTSGSAPLTVTTPQEMGREGGRKGGTARAKNLHAEALSAIGRKGAEARWGKKPAEASTLYLTGPKPGTDIEKLVQLEMRFFHCAETLATQSHWTAIDLINAIRNGKEYSDGEWFKTRILLLERGFVTQKGVKSRATYDVTDRCHTYLKIASEEAIVEGLRALTDDGCLSVADRIQKLQELLAKAGPKGLYANDLAEQLGGEKSRAQDAIRRALTEKVIEDIDYSKMKGRLLVLKGSKKAPKPAEPEPPVPQPEPIVEAEPAPPRSTRWLKEKINRQVQKVIVALGDYPQGLDHEELVKLSGVLSPMLLQIQPILTMRKICAMEGKAIKTHYRLNSAAAGKWLVDRFRDEDVSVNGAIHA